MSAAEIERVDTDSDEITDWRACVNWLHKVINDPEVILGILKLALGVLEVALNFFMDLLKEFNERLLKHFLDRAAADVFEDGGHYPLSRGARCRPAGRD